jgi:hypothetical protein
MLEQFFDDYGNYMFYYGLENYTIDKKIPEELRQLYNLYTDHKNLIQMVRQNANHKLTTEQQTIINEWNTLIKNYMLDPNNDYDAGFFLRRFNTLTNEPGGYDTGEFGARVTEAMILKSITYTNDGTQTTNKVDFHIYDMFGRGYMVPVKSWTVATSYEDGILTVDNSDIFRSAKDETTFTIAVEKPNGDYEFMMYNKKDNNRLSILNRALFNGIGINVENGDTVYVI